MAEEPLYFEETGTARTVGRILHGLIVLISSSSGKAGKLEGIRKRDTASRARQGSENDAGGGPGGRAIEAG